MRHAMGVAVFAGMLGVTFFGLIFTPLFYVLIRGWNERQAANRAARRERRLLEHAARES
jgi:multidrug efflux pump